MNGLINSFPLSYCLPVMQMHASSSRILFRALRSEASSEVVIGRGLIKWYCGDREGREIEGVVPG